MREVLNAIDEWKAEGHRVAIATVTKVKGSAPRPPGAKMAISD
ncbi:MAG TPA: XdhC family protein, partial [Actinomycetes bacterium]|nr:XdhC family protein [Actinomycetes bacterium]